MNKWCIDPGHILPPTSFVSFEAHRLRQPSVVWRNPDVDMQMDLSAYEFAIPSKDEPSSAFLPETKVFQAERYGGAGLAGNGGGARCGNLNGIQVKGIGRTPLVGTETEFWYSHGAASMQEGLNEALWGEICHAVLPYGGARTYGIIATSTECPLEVPTGISSARRAVIVRQPHIRPAHFMRAIYFKPNAKVLEEEVSDTTRTREAIKQFPTALAMLLDVTGASPIERVNEGLIKIVKRFALQMSFARARRLMHGSLNCSNICLNGGWIDFETISTLSDFGRIVIARNFPDLWFQHTPLQRTLAQLLFYLGKYLPDIFSKELISARELHDIFVNEINDVLAGEYVHLIGVPKRFAKLVSANHVEALNRCFTKIIKVGNGQPFKLSPKHVVEMPEKMGSFNLSHILQNLSYGDNAMDMSEAVKELLPDTKLRQELCTCVETIVLALKQTLGLIEHNILNLELMMNAVRRNGSFVELYRPNLDRMIASFCSSENGISQIFAKLIAKARTLLLDPIGSNIDFASLIAKSPKDFSTEINFAPNDHSLHRIPDVVRSMDPSICPEQLKARILIRASELLQRR
jgi:hypothetical protein